MQTKQQERAKFALDKILESKNSLSKNDFHGLANFIVSMPNMILSNGLGQTLAFLLTKDAKQKQVFVMIKEWIITNKKYDIRGDNSIEFLKSFTNIDQKKYIIVQDEVLRLVEWLKRYARAFDEKRED